MIKIISGRLTRMNSYIIGLLVGAILVSVVCCGLLCIKAKNQDARIGALEKEIKRIVKLSTPEPE